jgi:hypothetical protein
MNPYTIFILVKNTIFIENTVTNEEDEPQDDSQPLALAFILTSRLLIDETSPVPPSQC